MTDVAAVEAAIANTHRREWARPAGLAQVDGGRDDQPSPQPQGAARGVVIIPESERPRRRRLVVARSP